MASNSDNEINFDATLRQHIKNSGVAKVAVCNRFDADEANAYLERAMNTNALSAYETHLADCTMCRRHLIELSRLMPQPETNSVAGVATEINESKILAGWRQWFSGWRLGALAGLGAATAALVLFFVNVQFSPKDATVAVADKKIESPSPLRGVNSEPSKDPFIAQATPIAEAPAQIKSGASPATAEKPNDLARQVVEPKFRADGALGESTTAAPPPPAAVAPVADAAPKREEAVSNFSQTQDQINAAEWRRATPTPTPRGPAANQMQVDRAMVMKQAQAAEEKAEKDKKDLALNNRNVVPLAESTDSARTAEKEKRVEAALERVKPAAKAPAKPAPVATRAVAGKEFQMMGGIWTDTNYNASGNLPVVRVKSNSDEYKKILSAMPGLKPYFELQTVLVVWQGKVYRVEK